MITRTAGDCAAILAITGDTDPTITAVCRHLTISDEYAVTIISTFAAIGTVLITLARRMAQTLIADPVAQAIEVTLACDGLDAQATDL